MMAVPVSFIIAALEWPLRTAIFPVVISIPVLLLALREFVLDLFGKEEDDQETVPEETDSRKTRSIFLWILGFFLLIMLVGFPIAVPFYLFLYLKVRGREAWGISIGLAAAGGCAFYGLFVRLLEVPFLEGWLQSGLKTLGIGL